MAETRHFGNAAGTGFASCVTPMGRSMIALAAAHMLVWNCIKLRNVAQVCAKLRVGTFSRVEARNIAQNCIQLDGNWMARWVLYRYAGTSRSYSPRARRLSCSARRTVAAAAERSRIHTRRHTWGVTTEGRAEIATRGPSGYVVIGASSSDRAQLSDLFGYDLRAVADIVKENGELDRVGQLSAIAGGALRGEPAE